MPSNWVLTCSELPRHVGLDTAALSGPSVSRGLAETTTDLLQLRAGGQSYSETDLRRLRYLEVRQAEAQQLGAVVLLQGGQIAHRKMPQVCQLRDRAPQVEAAQARYMLSVLLFVFYRVACTRGACSGATKCCRYPKCCSRLFQVAAARPGGIAGGHCDLPSTLFLLPQGGHDKRHGAPHPTSAAGDACKL